MNNIIWAAVLSATLAAVSLFMATSNPEISLSLGLASIASAILATRE